MGILSSAGHDVIVSGLTMVVLASIAVCFRFVAKNMTKSGVRADDYWALVGLIVFWTYVGVMLWGMFDGADGTGPNNLVPLKYDELKIFLIALRIDIPLFGTAITPVKISILCLYRRLFPASLIKHGTPVLGVFCLLWWISVTLGITFSCFWQSEIVPHCINFNTFYLVMCLWELFIDVLILCLPLRDILWLQVPLREKVILFMMFLVGGFVCVTSIVRIVMTYRLHHNEVAFMRGMVWNNIQLGTAIMCACFLTYRPLLLKCTILFPILPKRSPSSRFLPSSSRFPNIPRLQISSTPNEPKSGSQYDLVQPPSQLHQSQAWLDDQAVPTAIAGGPVDLSADRNSRIGKNGSLRMISVNNGMEIV